jgi:two-component system nitrogen regulation sensor histidine kinase NtrY
MSRLRRTLSYDVRLTLAVLVAGLLPWLLLIVSLRMARVSGYLVALVAVLHGMVVAYCAYYVYSRTTFQLRTVSNLLDAMVRGDYSLRGTPAAQQDGLSELIQLINRLANTLSEQKLETRESQLLLNRVISQVDFAILIVDDGGRIGVANAAASRLLAPAGDELVGRSAQELGLTLAAVADAPQRHELNLPDGRGKFYVLAERFSANQREHRLVFITDIQRLLRDEERQAWQSLVRVLGHEINNSLSPISSIADTLTRMTRRGLQPDDGERLREGLGVIVERSQSLAGFLHRYRQLTKLPAPQREPAPLAAMIARVAALFEGRRITADGPPALQVFVDAAQFEQLLVNLLKNAIEASAPEQPVDVRWSVEPGRVRIAIRDHGPGLSDTRNLFVPYYSTKPGGSGIGLFLSRQIAFNHDGEVQLHNHGDGPGAEAVIWVPHHSGDRPRPVVD